MKKSIPFGLLVLLLVFAAALNIGLGSVWISPREVFQSLFTVPYPTPLMNTYCGLIELQKQLLQWPLEQDWPFVAC